MRKLLVGSALVVGCLILVYLALWGRVGVFKFEQPFFTEPAGEIYGERSVGQSFLAAYPGLSEIDLLLASYQRSNTEPVIFRLKEGGSEGKELVTITIQGPTIEDNTYRSLTFGPIDDSARKRYYFSLESPSSTPGNAITLWNHAGDVYADGERYIGGSPTSGDLAFRAHYRGKIVPAMSALLVQLGRDKPSILGEKWFYATLAMLYVGALAIFLTVIVCSPSPRAD